MEPYDPIYENVKRYAHDYIDETLSQRIDDLRFRLGEESIVPLQQEISYLTHLVVQHQMLITWQRVLHRIQTVSEHNPSADMLSKIKAADSILLKHLDQFLGAMRETEDPITLYQETLDRLRKELARVGVDMLLQEFDELPPPPPPAQASS